MNKKDVNNLKQEESSAEMLARIDEQYPDININSVEEFDAMVKDIFTKKMLAKVLAKLK